MNPHPDSILWLAGIHHREWQEDAMRARLVREAYGDAPLMPSALATLWRRLEEVAGHARRYLVLNRRAPTELLRGAIPPWPRLSTEREIRPAPTR